MIFALRRCPHFEVSVIGASRELGSPAGDESGEARAEWRVSRAQAD